MLGFIILVAIVCLGLLLGGVCADTCGRFLGDSRGAGFLLVLLLVIVIMVVFGFLHGDLCN